MTRTWSAAVAAVVSVPAAGILVFIELQPGHGMGTFLYVMAAVTVPVGTIVGAVLARRVPAPGQSYSRRLVIGSALLATVLGAYASAAVATALDSAAWFELPVLGIRDLLSAAIVGTYGLVIFGPPMLVLTVPTAAAWQWAVRRIARRDPLPAPAVTASASVAERGAGVE